LGEGDAESVTGVENLTGKDDQGNFLVSEESFARRPGVRGFDLYPDQWSEFRRPWRTSSAGDAHGAA
jgi:hypothetical protein